MYRKLGFLQTNLLIQLGGSEPSSAPECVYSAEQLLAEDNLSHQHTLNLSLKNVHRSEWNQDGGQSVDLRTWEEILLQFCLSNWKFWL